MKKLTAKKLDAHISESYRTLAQGKMINIMDIGKVFDAGRKAYAETSDLIKVDEALAGQIQVLCMPT